MAEIKLPDLVSKLFINDAALDKTAKKAGEFKLDIGKTAAIVGASIAGIGLVLTKMGQDVERSQITLRKVIENAGFQFDDYGAKIDAAIKKQANFGNKSNEVRDALAKLTLRLKDPQKALENLGFASDIARLRQISLGDATDEVGKILAGNSKVLAKYGVDLKGSVRANAEAEAATKLLEKAHINLGKSQQDLSDLEAVLSDKKQLTIKDEQNLRDARQDVIDATANLNAAEKTHTEKQAAVQTALTGTKEAVEKVRVSVQGLAEAQAETLRGKLDALITRLQNFAGEIGKVAGPVLTGLGTALGLGASAMNILDSATFKATAAAIAHGVAAVAVAIGSGIAAAATGVWTAALHLLNIALKANPIGLVVTAIGLLVAGLILAWKRSETFRDVVKGAFEVVKDVVQKAVDVFNAVWKAIDKVIDAVKDVIGWFGKLKLPDWLTPGSPSPFEESLLRTVALLKKMGSVMPDFPSGGNFTTSVQPALAVAGGGNIAPIGGDITVTVPLTLDGRKIAEATAILTRDELLKLGRRNAGTGL